MSETNGGLHDMVMDSGKEGYGASVTRLARDEQFVRLLASHQHGIFRYIVSLVPNAADAQDVLQETAVALWKKADQYDPSQPFLPWARTFAYYEVLNHRKQCRREQRNTVLLSHDVIEALSADRDKLEEILEARQQALAACLKKLGARSSQLVQQRYQGKGDAVVRKLAEKTGQNANTLYKRLARIRSWLFQCINRALATEVSS